MKKKYIIGIIIDNNRKVGVAVYDLASGQVEIRSKQSVVDEYLEQENIVGIEHQKQTVYRVRDGDFKEKNYPQLRKNGYDTRKLSVIDCEGNVLIAGADVCIGTIGIEADKKYIVVNSKGELRFLSKEEVVKEKIIGIIQRDKRIDVIRDCKNIYMTMDEFERR